MFCCCESFRSWNLLKLCYDVLLLLSNYLILLQLLWVLTKHHSFKHAFQFNSTFPLLYHFLVHTFVVVDILPAFFLCTKIKLFCLRLRLFLLALTLIRPRLIASCTATTSVSVVCLSTTLTTTSILCLIVVLLLSVVFLFNAIANMIWNRSFFGVCILNHDCDFILSTIDQLVDFWLNNFNYPVYATILDSIVDFVIFD